MINQNNQHSIKQELPAVLLFVGLIWLVFALDRVLPLEQFGLIPRNGSHLVGIVTMPFLHGSLQHIMSNTVPLLVLLTLLAGSRANSRTIVLSIVLLGGALLWLFGRGAALHIGASGLVFGLAVFLIVSGLLERRVIPMLIAIFVTFMYGSSLLSGILPWQPGVSWDGHLFGGIAGAVAAFFLVRGKQVTSKFRS
ncbi:rhomboid family intramembrane serine protease [uncultured Thiothrix sp.]|uniref:rhomboid family intramembrane serine protease n=1 Tax=uncultured Thiothrix sp. TaxID=223185 RepID=UPI00260185D0|nr:rhomboid family intramembrane serine protease [uncultured Thiothrix sp.]